MKKLEKVDLKVLGNGTHRFEYELDTEFFNEMQADIENLDESQRISSAKVRADITLSVTDLFAKTDYSTKGIVCVPCDRCLQPVEVTIEAEDEETADNDTMDLGWLLYEQVILSIPLTHTHDEQDCDPEMMRLLKDASRDNK